MITIIETNPSKRPMTFGDIKIGDFFIYNDDLFVKTRDIEEKTYETDDWYELSPDGALNAVCLTGKDVGQPFCLEQDEEVALLKKDIRISFDPTVDLQRWV